MKKKKKIYENQNYSFQTNHTLVSFENNHVICREISFSSVLENKFHWGSGVPVNMSTEILKNQLVFSFPTTKAAKHQKIKRVIPEILFFGKFGPKNQNY